MLRQDVREERWVDAMRTVVSFGAIRPPRVLVTHTFKLDEEFVRYGEEESVVE
jgi:hypothetical protein